MKNVRCEKCGHEWNSKSKLNILICACCNQKVKINQKENKRQELGRT